MNNRSISARAAPRFVPACYASLEQKRMLRETVRANEGATRGIPTYDRCSPFQKAPASRVTRKK